MEIAKGPGLTWIDVGLNCFNYHHEFGNGRCASQSPRRTRRGRMKSPVILPGCITGDTPVAQVGDMLSTALHVTLQLLELLQVCRHLFFVAAVGGDVVGLVDAEVVLGGDAFGVVVGVLVALAVTQAL